MMHARVSVTGTRQQTADASLRLNTVWTTNSVWNKMVQRVLDRVLKRDPLTTLLDGARGTKQELGFSFSEG